MVLRDTLSLPLLPIADQRHDMRVSEAGAEGFGRKSLVAFEKTRSYHEGNWLLMEAQGYEYGRFWMGGSSYWSRRHGVGCDGENVSRLGHDFSGVAAFRDKPLCISPLVWIFNDGGALIVLFGIGMSISLMFRQRRQQKPPRD